MARERELKPSRSQSQETIMITIFASTIASFALSAVLVLEPSVVLDSAEIDTEITALMERESVQGLAICYIDGGEIQLVRAFGWRNAEERRPLEIDTVMYGASLTKTAFAYMVLQLVDEGVLGLDDTVEELLSKPLTEYGEEGEDYQDLEDDDRWKRLTPRIILNNATGFANFRWLEDDQTLRFHHDPGSRYGYSAEGYYILQLVLEEEFGLDIGREMKTRVFDRFGMTDTSKSWRPNFRENLADGYRIDGEMEPHDERSSVSAAGSMDTSIADQAKMWVGIMRGDGLTPESRAELVRPQRSINSAFQFPTLSHETDERAEKISLSAGLGLVTFQDTSGHAWFKGGHNPWTGNMVIGLEGDQRCLVMLANDVRAERIFPEIAELILGETLMPWWWEYNAGD